MLQFFWNGQEESENIATEPTSNREDLKSNVWTWKKVSCFENDVVGKEEQESFTDGNRHSLTYMHTTRTTTVARYFKEKTINESTILFCRLAIAFGMFQKQIHGHRKRMNEERLQMSSLAQREYSVIGTTAKSFNAYKYKTDNRGRTKSKSNDQHSKGFCFLEGRKMFIPHIDSPLP
jgi:hypothetical protein